MTWIDHFFSSPVALPVSLIILGIIGMLSWKKKGHQVILALTLLLYVRYLFWRGLYTINTSDITTLAVSWAVFTAEVYAFIQVVLFAYHAWSPLDRKPVPLRQFPTVDIFVTIVNEPTGILRRTLVGCLSQRYPKDRYRVHILDDGQREDLRVLAETLGCGYIRRTQRVHAKAGNINHALGLTYGEIVAIFDVDHVPTADFLTDTVGFFQDDQVAFVQTPHAFYNPDIFQKNLQLEGELANEQSLFYRVLQAGRDHHNSAFFAGSCGLFRRKALLEIGGFRTETVTEDIHTSMMVHAKGYRSCYLNKVLAAGLMPETFESSMKQRIRWAMGHVQIFFQTNPFTLRGLTMAQRIGYFASIFYFFHGIPRLICLIAPLFALLLGIIPVTAGVSSILLFFGSYYAATLIMLRTVSRGTRNAFWSDIYETAGSVALAWAVLKTAVNPRKRRPFVITPKGATRERRGISRFSYILPHILIMGCLIAGIVTGIRLWMTDLPVPGLGVSLFWASINLVLVTISILASAEIPEWRRSLRIKHRMPCALLTEQTCRMGTVIDIHETGALVRTSYRIPQTQTSLFVRLPSVQGSPLIVKSRICHQEQIASDVVEMGVTFVDVEDRVSDRLVAGAFMDASRWNQPNVEPGIFRSLWSICRAFRKFFITTRLSHRHDERLSFRQPCRLKFRTSILSGTIEQISKSGVAIRLACATELPGEQGILYMRGCVLKVQPRWVRSQDGEVLAGFLIEHAYKGSEQWKEFASSAA